MLKRDPQRLQGRQQATEAMQEAIAAVAEAAGRVESTLSILNQVQVSLAVQLLSAWAVIEFRAQSWS